MTKYCSTNDINTTIEVLKLVLVKIHGTPASIKLSPRLNRVIMELQELE